MPSIKGTASVADPRARSKALKATKFPKNFSQAVLTQKVNRPVLNQWIEQKITTLLGFEDEIVASTAINLFLEEARPDPKRAQLDLAGFLGDEQAAKFAKELWSLLLEAQTATTGIPQTLLEEKKKELALQKQKQQNNKQGLTSSSAHPASQNSRSAGNVVHPEMNRFVQEAARRADAARQQLGGLDNHNETAAPAPVSPPPRHQQAPPPPVPIEPEHQPNDRRKAPPASAAIPDKKNSNPRDRKPAPNNTSGSSDSPDFDAFGRRIRSSGNERSRGGDHRSPRGGPPPPPRRSMNGRGGGSSRSRSRSRERRPRGSEARPSGSRSMDRHRRDTSHGPMPPGPRDYPPPHHHRRGGPPPRR